MTQGAWSLALPAALAALLQVLFFSVDGRIPWDPARLFTDVPLLWQALHSEPSRALVHGLTHSGGWYELLLAVLLRLHRAPWVVEAVLVGWVALLVLSTTGLTRRLAGERAGLLAGLVVAGAPSVLLLGRHLWVHLPEAALMTSMAWAWAADPRLKRWRTVALLAVLGLLLARLRPSGLVPLGLLSLTLLLVPGDQGWRHKPWSRLAPLLLLFGATAGWMLWGLTEYQQVKGPPGLFHHEPLAWSLPQTLWALGPAGAVLLGVGLVSLALAWRAAPPSREHRSLWALVALWTLAPPLLMLRYHSGAGDFTWLAPVAAVLTGAGLVRLGPSALAVASLPLALAAVVPWTGSPGLADLWGSTVHPLPSDQRLVQTRWSQPVLRAISESCPHDQPAPCHVIAPAGLFHPLRSEDLGLLELFLLGRDTVELRGLGDRVPRGWKRWGVHGMAVWECAPEEHAEWLDKYPGLIPSTADLVESLDLVATQQVQLGTCTWSWLRPPPAQADPQLRWSVEDYRAMGEALRQSRPHLPPEHHLPQSRVPGRGPGR